MKKLDWIGLIENGYELDSEDGAWLRSLIQAAPFEDGSPIAGYGFELGASEMRLTEYEQAGSDVDLEQSTRELNTENDKEAVDAMFRTGFTTGTMSETMFKAFPEQAEIFAAKTHGLFKDAIGCVARDGRSSGVVIVQVLPEMRNSSAHERKRWTRAAAHLGAARRLRRRLASTSLDDSNVEAILRPDGQIEDARGVAKSRSARDTLRDAVGAIDRARSSARSDPEESMGLWRGLVEGRWSMIDHFDTDGKRWVVARRNDVSSGDPRGLTPRELEVAELVGLGETNKAISYRLGISQAAVSAALQKSITKLGLGGRAEVAAFFAPCGPRWRLLRTEIAGEPILIARSAGLCAERMSTLTEAEAAVTLELVRGATNQSIAAARDTSPSTVANQIAAIYDKLGVSTRAELSVALHS